MREILPRIAVLVTLLFSLSTSPPQSAAPTPGPGLVSLGQAMPESTTAPLQEPIEIEPDIKLRETPTPTISWQEQAALDGVEKTAKRIAHWCVWYLPLVDRWNPDFDLPRDIVLAVMAKESHCLEDMDDGVSVGLMAVTPRSWTATHDELRKPAINIYWGMYILDSTLHSKNNPEEDMRTALAAYNCGWESLLADECIGIGGYAYADDVLGFWLPRIQAEMGQ